MRLRRLHAVAWIHRVLRISTVPQISKKSAKPEMALPDEQVPVPRLPTVHGPGCRFGPRPPVSFFASSSLYPQSFKARVFVGTALFTLMVGTH
jgi:hypothetical protein